MALFKSPATTVGLTSAPGSLQAFYKRFCSNTTLETTNYLNYINTPTFFDCVIEKITPGVTTTPTTKGYAEGIADKIKGSKLGQLANDIKAGFDSVKNAFDKDSPDPRKIDFDSVLKKYKAKDNINDDVEYLSPSFLILLAEAMNFSFEDDFKYFVQSATLPELSLATEAFSNSINQEFLPTFSGHVNPSTYVLSLEILDTLFPLHEYAFYPWMREAGNDLWQYPDQPFTKANIKISYLFPEYAGSIGDQFADLGNAISDATFGLIPTGTDEKLGSSSKNTWDNAAFTYVFVDCYPIRIEAIPTNQVYRKKYTRTVDFAFSQVFIRTSEVIKHPNANKLINGIANRLVNPLTNKLTQPLTGGFMGNR